MSSTLNGDGPRISIRPWLHQNELSLVAEKSKHPASDDVNEEIPKASSYVDNISDKTMKAWMKSKELETKLDDALLALNWTKSSDLDDPKLDKATPIDGAYNGTGETSQSHLAMEHVLREQDAKIENLLKSIEEQKKEDFNTIHACHLQINELKDIFEKQVLLFTSAMKTFEDTKQSHQDEVHGLNETILELRQDRMDQDKALKEQKEACDYMRHQMELQEKTLSECKKSLDEIRGTMQGQNETLNEQKDAYQEMRDATPTKHKNLKEKMESFEELMDKIQIHDQVLKEQKEAFEEIKVKTIIQDEALKEQNEAFKEIKETVETQCKTLNEQKEAYGKISSMVQTQEEMKCKMQVYDKVLQEQTEAYEEVRITIQTHDKTLKEQNEAYQEMNTTIQIQGKTLKEQKVAYEEMMCKNQIKNNLTAQKEALETERMVAEEQSRKKCVMQSQKDVQKRLSDVTSLQDKLTLATFRVSRLNDQLSDTVEENRLLKERMEQLERDNETKALDVKMSLASVTQMVSENRELQKHLQDLQESWRSELDNLHLELRRKANKLEQSTMENRELSENLDVVQDSLKSQLASLHAELQRKSEEIQRGDDATTELRENLKALQEIVKSQSENVQVEWRHKAAELQRSIDTNRELQEDLELLQKTWQSQSESLRVELQQKADALQRSTDANGELQEDLKAIQESWVSQSDSLRVESQRKVEELQQSAAAHASHVEWERKAEELQRNIDTTRDLQEDLKAMQENWKSQSESLRVDLQRKTDELQRSTDANRELQEDLKAIQESWVSQSASLHVELQRKVEELQRSADANRELQGTLQAVKDSWKSQSDSLHDELQRRMEELQQCSDAYKVSEKMANAKNLATSRETEVLASKVEQVEGLVAISTKKVEDYAKEIEMMKESNSLLQQKTDELQRITEAYNFLSDKMDNDENAKNLVTSHEMAILRTTLDGLVSKVEHAECLVANNITKLESCSKGNEQMSESNSLFKEDFDGKLKEHDTQIGNLGSRLDQLQADAKKHQIVMPSGTNKTESIVMKMELQQMKQSMKELQTLQVSNHNLVQRKLTQQKGEIDSLEQRVKNASKESITGPQTHLVTLEEFNRHVASNQVQLDIMRTHLDQRCDAPALVTLKEFNDHIESNQVQLDIMRTQLDMRREVMAIEMPLAAFDSKNLEIEDKWNAKFDSHSKNMSSLFDELKAECEIIKNTQADMPNKFKQLEAEIESLNIRIDQQVNDLAAYKTDSSDVIYNKEEANKSLIVEIARSKEAISEIRALIKLLKSEHETNLSEIRTKLETDGSHVKTKLNAIDKEIADFEKDRSLSQADLDFIKSFVSESVGKQMQVVKESVENHMNLQQETRDDKNIVMPSIEKANVNHDILLREWDAKFEVHQIKLLQLAEDGAKVRQQLGSMNKKLQASSSFQEEVERKLEYWYTWVESLENKIREHSSAIETMKHQEVAEETSNTVRNPNGLAVANKAKVRLGNDVVESYVDNLRRGLKNKQNQLQASIEVFRNSPTKVGTEVKVDSYLEQMERIEFKLAEQAKMLNMVLAEKESLQAEVAAKEEKISSVLHSLKKSNEQLQASKWENRGLHLAVSNLKDKEQEYKQKLDRLLVGNQATSPSEALTGRMAMQRSETRKVEMRNHSKKRHSELLAVTSSTKQHFSIQSPTRERSQSALPVQKHMQTLTHERSQSALPSLQKLALKDLESRE